jgi:hypothetical protein
MYSWIAALAPRRVDLGACSSDPETSRMGGDPQELS